eukprot:TRINITY_DN4342_c1_g1_i1.p1 TRINITY_DN4342_c1_g1~~TRINITY_DN4342_c1_g1_i1.p1  ORF type:complete len:103 (+),score=17.41 TRINITY_DN4342_c1_g1_i1:225-533(+)
MRYHTVLFVRAQMGTVRLPLVSAESIASAVLLSCCLCVFAVRRCQSPSAHKHVKLKETEELTSQPPQIVGSLGNDNDDADNPGLFVIADEDADIDIDVDDLS